MKYETITGSTDSNGLFTAGNPYSPKHAAGTDFSEFDWFSRQHPPLFCYNENNVLVKGVEGLEVKGPIWQKWFKELQQWEPCDDGSIELELYRGDEYPMEKRQVYIAVQPTEKAVSKESLHTEKVKPHFTHRAFNEMNFTEFQVQLRCCLIIKDGFDNEWMQDFYADFTEDYKAGRYDTVKEWANDFFQDVTLDTHSYCLVSKVGNTLPEAQPLEGVKTAEEILEETDDYDNYGNGISIDAIIRAMHSYHAQFATVAGGGKGNPYYYEQNTQDDMDAADGYKMDFDKNFGHNIPEHRKNGFLDGCRWKAHQLQLQAPSTHSSSEMVEVKKVVALVNSFFDNSTTISNAVAFLVEDIRALTK